MNEVVGCLVLVGVVMLILLAAALITSGMKFRSASHNEGGSGDSEEAEPR
jgi:hypothetical protein